jgi:predicted HNH restriction endonuclease
LAGASSWAWDDHSAFQRYKRTPSRNGYYTPSKDPSGSEWEDIAPAFFDYLDVLCTRGHRADHRTSSTPGLREEIAAWATQEIEAASFEQAVRIARRSSSDERRERLRTAPRKPAVVATVVNVFQRNPDVVAEVLTRAAGTCELCMASAPFVRASDGTPYLEVHHRVRLADGGDDTVENAVAACPNCHRKAHFG